ncbi:MAG: cytochrome P450 [Umezawaea sp.]
MRRAGGLPPGPRLPGIVQTLWWAVSPVHFGTTCVKRYGPVFTARILGFGPVVHVCSPEGIRRILLEEAAEFDAAAANRVIDFVVGERSLLMSEGEAHTTRRRQLSRPLHGANVAGYVELMERIIEREVRSWEVGSRVRLHECFQRVTLEVMLRAVFGVTDSARLDRLRVLVPKLLDLNPLIVLLPAARRSFGGIGPWVRFKRIIDEVDVIIRGEIADRRASGERGGSDVLSVLLADSDAAGAGDDELRDHLVTVLAVGQETTATQLAWFFERLLRHPATLADVRAAVTEGDEQVLDAAVHEAMRARPTTLDVGRVNRRPWSVGGYEVPAGTLFAVSIGLMHLSADQHDRPDEYRIERFHPAPPPSTHFVPFGGGVHRCLGASLAMVEMRTVISSILRHVSFALPRPEPERVAPKGPMLVPGRGTEVWVVTNRLAGAGKQSAIRVTS